MAQVGGDLPGADGLCRQALDAYPPVGIRLITPPTPSTGRQRGMARLHGWPEMLSLAPDGTIVILPTHAHATNDRPDPVVSP
ncbi:hypothetical protein KO481_20645 [Nocardia sp. NEAU-G5]|uniref:Uncharacterized protein n=1 Tax=Nocardia albiluteola TaxID=2842303 RepID=A0ABS6B3V7_9NOCA|nr:hypothetical protein [Nocardia albiluteola]MBU3063928.1 hypothetical protein [Nocardia albiluteola]